jgi:hypothetical protein
MSPSDLQSKGIGMDGLKQSAGQDEIEEGENVFMKIIMCMKRDKKMKKVITKINSTL